jgi:three-Cys-motif partner protein
VAGPKGTVWELEPHTAAKHAILRKYLNAWLPILTRWNGRVVFCDGFAGPGAYAKGEDGSPVIAIKTFLEHAHSAKMKAEVVYLFIEEKRDRYQSLVNVVSRRRLPKNVKVTTINKTYEEAFSDVLDYIDAQKTSLAPTFAFIDPFGIKGLPLKIIRRLMAHDKCEVFITFMLGFLHRFLTTEEFEPHCDALFGTTEWRAAINMESSRRERFLRRLYQRRLSDTTDGVGARYVRYFTMKDERGRTIYDLFFATNSGKGVDAMKDAMWQIDKSGGFQFSDATDPAQETLFSEEPEWNQLFDLLAAQFSGSKQSWQMVKEAIRHSPFRALKKPFIAEAKREGARFRIVNPPDAKKGTLHEHASIVFV